MEVAKHYNKLAVNLNRQWHSAVPKKWELAFLPQEHFTYEHALKTQLSDLSFKQRGQACFIRG